MATKNPLAQDAADEAQADPGRERRLHIRAFDWWEGMLDGREMPAFADLTPDGLAPFRDRAFLVDFSAGYGEPTLKFVGAAIEQQQAGLGLSGTALMDIPRRTLLGRLVDHYMEVLANRAPIGFEAEYNTGESTEVLYRGILLPLSDDGDNIHFILGVVNWKVQAARQNAQNADERISELEQNEPAQVSAPGDPDWQEVPAPEDVESALKELKKSLSAANADIEADRAPEVARPQAAPDDGVSGQDAAEGLAGLVAKARAAASRLGSTDQRTRDALYDALALAYSVYCEARNDPDDYAALLAEAGIKAQSRAPHTPVIKLVFGDIADRPRITEYALTLAHADRQKVSSDGFRRFIDEVDGGMKACVRAERQARRAPGAQTAKVRLEQTRARLADAPALPGPADCIAAPGDSPFVLVLARRVDQDSVAAIRVLDEKASTIDAVIKRLPDAE